MAIADNANKFGSIPACAGEPRASPSTDRKPRVYPRVCGGTRRLLAYLFSAHGLSPRVRGNRRPASRRRSLLRSIPACAGEPRGRPPPRPLAGVYPRVCGGTRLTPNALNARRGLSPRVRGNRGEPARTLAAVRSIPACAGEPATAPGRTTTSRVYPRVCGGTASSGPGSRPDVGLSPRVRGNPGAHAIRHLRFGSIPACAGEPF